MSLNLQEVVGSTAYVATVVCFALHLIFDRRFRRQLRVLARQQRQLERRIAAMSRQDSWVVGNAAFSHAPWVLVCLTGSYYRVAGRYFYKSCLVESRQWLSDVAVPGGDRRVYRGCFDLYGVFADVGSYGSLKDLSEQACRSLKLGFPVVVAAPETAVSEPELPVVQPEVVSPEPVRSVLPPLFSSRFR